MTSLRQRFIEDMQVRNFSLVTQASYTREVSGFARHFNKSPELLGPEQIRAYQIYLTNEKKLGIVSISVATSALRFLYRVTLKKNWCMADMIPAPKVPKKLPIILSPEEVVRFLDRAAMRKHRAVLATCYGCQLGEKRNLCVVTVCHPCLGSLTQSNRDSKPSQSRSFGTILPSPSFHPKNFPSFLRFRSHLRRYVSAGLNIAEP
jgi:hypothetical protein